MHYVHSHVNMAPGAMAQAVLMQLFIDLLQNVCSCSKDILLLVCNFDSQS